jgi:cobalt/nickel transport system permease protein
MHVDVFDQFQHTESRIHGLDPRVKVVVAVGFILSNAILPDGSWLAFGLAWLWVLLVNDQANLGLGFSLKRSVIVLPFVLVAVRAIFSPLGEPL